MKIIAFAAMVILIVAAAPVLAGQDAIAGQCRADVKALCLGAAPDKGGAALCLRERFAETSPECRSALVRAALAAQACRADRRALCAGIPAGGGRVTACLRARLDRLGEDCRAVLASRAAPDTPPHTEASEEGHLGGLTCGQTMRARLGRAATLIAWLSGYLHGRAGAGMIAPGRLEPVLDRVGAYCSVRPDALLVDAVEAVAGPAR